MEVSTNPNYGAAKRVDQKKKDLENQEAALVEEQARIASEQKKAVNGIKEKSAEELVQISEESSRLAQAIRNQHSATIEQGRKINEDAMLKLAEDASARLKALDQETADKLNAAQRASLEKLNASSSKTSDSFYKGHALNASMSREGEGYVVKLNLPPHEAKNLFVTSEGHELKLSLARSSAHRVDSSDGERTNRTNSYQTVVETFKLPELVDGKRITREYDGSTLTIRLSKA